jgi:hypothetical protein
MAGKKHNDETDDERDEREYAEAQAATEAKAAAKAAPKVAEAPPPFPFTASINEPQTVSLPLPEGIVVPKPVITGYDPYECTLGDPDFPLVITGENFFADSVITFAGHDEPTTFDADAKTLSTGINMAVWHGPDTVQVTVKNGPEVSDPVEFTFNEAPAARKGKK